MKREFYESLNRNVRQKNCGSIIKIINNSITLAVFVFYPVLLICLFLGGYNIIRLAAVPLGAFILVSILRYFLNFKRPYEQMEIEPLTATKKSGKSFPSRHTFSIFMIALCCYRINIAVGVLLTVLGVLLAALRVISGAHYIRDVAAGAAAAVLAYIIGFICF